MRRIGDNTAEPYQERLLEDVRAALQAGRSGAVLAPTGSGKSLVIAGGIEDVLALKRPVIVIQPSADLLNQNLRQMAGTAALSGAHSLAVWAAKDEEVYDPRGEATPRGYDADVVFATQAAFTKSGEFAAHLAEFGRRKGVIFIDEGHGAAALEFGKHLRLAAKNGAQGVLLSATPFRADGEDILQNFGTTLEEGLIAVAGHDEVRATGRILPARFVSAHQEFRLAVGEAVLAKIEGYQEDTLERGASIDRASMDAIGYWFREDASEAEQKTGEALVDGVARVWGMHAPGRALAMIHCDAVEFARGVARRLALDVLPDGHPEAGRPVRVGHVDGEEVRLFIDGREQEIEGPAAGRRQKILEMARAGALDALVSCRALGVGTDVRRADLTILAALERTASPAIQIAGRTARSYEDPKTGAVKSDHLVVDLGRSFERLFQDAEMIAAGRPEEARRNTRGLPEPVIRQIREFFADDPRYEARMRQEMRQRGLHLAPGQRLFHGGRQPRAEELEARPEAVFTAFAKGVQAAARLDARPDGSTVRRASLLIDLKAANLAGAARRDLLVVVASSDQPGAPSAWHATNDLRAARVFAAAWGAGDDRARREKLLKEIPADAEQKRLGALAREAHKAAPWLSGLHRTARTRYGLEIQETAHLLLPDLVRTAASAARFLDHSAKAMAFILDRPQDMTAERLAMLGEYCREAQIKHVVVLAPDSKKPVEDAFAALGSETRIVRMSPERADPKTLAGLLKGLANGQMAALGPIGTTPKTTIIDRLEAARRGRDEAERSRAAQKAGPTLAQI